jgi:hypothetical protein
MAPTGRGAFDRCLRFSLYCASVRRVNLVKGGEFVAEESQIDFLAR